MGRQKSQRGKLRKSSASQKLETRFDCLKCHNENVVQCKILKAEQKGFAHCTVCEAYFKCNINSLDGPIDIYHAWSDNLS